MAGEKSYMQGRTFDSMSSKGGASRLYVSSEIRFYTINDLVEMLGWSEAIVQKLFNAPDFPSSDFGKQKVVEAHALIDYFSRKHVKSKEAFWCV